MFGLNRKKEERSIENPRVPISDANIISFLGLGSEATSGEPVTLETALGVPAVWAAINFLSGTMAGLPLHVYRRDRSGNRARVNGRLEEILNDAPNDEMSSFEWRKYLFDCILGLGRGLSYIERSANGAVTNIWPMEPNKVTEKMRDGRRIYDYHDGQRKISYTAQEVIDIPFMLSRDRLRSHSPILLNKDVIGAAIALTKYGGKFFANGGVPPFVFIGNFQTGAAMERASDDLDKAIKKANLERRLALSIPKDHEIKQIGAEPEKSQMIEANRFMVEQIARIYSLPPVFLQDLSHGTFSNTEQQDLQFVKHTLKRWVEQFEQELNLKLWGRNNRRQFVEFSMDGLLRGDFKTRMDGHATAIQAGIQTPNEARAMENKPPMEGGNKLYIQGANVPLDEAGSNTGSD